MEEEEEDDDDEVDSFHPSSFRCRALSREKKKCCSVSREMRCPTLVVLCMQAKLAS